MPILPNGISNYTSRSRPIPQIKALQPPECRHLMKTPQHEDLRRTARFSSRRYQRFNTHRAGSALRFSPTHF
jgi:hypothetical protein